MRYVKQNTGTKFDGTFMASNDHNVSLQLQIQVFGGRKKNGVKYEVEVSNFIMSCKFVSEVDCKHIKSNSHELPPKPSKVLLPVNLLLQKLFEPTCMVC